MIKQIVLMKLLDEADGHDKGCNGQRIKEGMEALPPQIEGMISSSVLLGDSGKYDVCITNEFENAQAKQFYAAHPLHQEIRGFIHKVVEDNRPAFECEI